jgi:glycosyltransferase involved in cell wall biosynthesis
MGVRFSIVRAAIAERLRYDLGPLREVVAQAVYVAAMVLIRTRRRSRQAQGFRLLMRLQTAAFSRRLDRRIADHIRKATNREKAGQPTGLWASYAAVVDAAVRALSASGLEARRYVGTRLLVIKAARPGERGVLVVDYSSIFPLLAGLFDLHAIAERYTMVLEPSWAGTCAPEVLVFSQLSQLVFVQTIEPRDHEFLHGIGTNLRVVPLAANWWVDPGPPPPATQSRDIDLIMVASWADMKRHWRVFRVLSRLRRQGRSLKVVLVGYAYGRTKQDIERLAEYFGIDDRVEAFEQISQEEVQGLLLRSKIHVLWSRRECANRAVIEAMIANVPSIVRDGLTFGFKYPYVNDQTGRFVPEHELEHAIMDMLGRRDRYSPHEWVRKNMSTQKATAILEDHLRAAAMAAGEPWTEGLVAKTSALGSQRYLNAADREKFLADYAFLESVICK